MIIPPIEQLLTRIHLRDQQAPRLAQDPERALRDVLPREHRQSPHLGDRQLTVILGMESDPEHAIATLAGVGVEREQLMSLDQRRQSAIIRAMRTSLVACILPFTG